MNDEIAVDGLLHALNSNRCRCHIHDATVLTHTLAHEGANLSNTIMGISGIGDANTVDVLSIILSH